ncbi:MAG: hypothetical protein ACK5V5_00440, partial [Cyclobacteriaceae bacterium]
MYTTTQQVNLDWNVVNGEIFDNYGEIFENYGVSIAVRWWGAGSVSASGSSVYYEEYCWFNDDWPNFGWECYNVPVYNYYYSNPLWVNPISGGTVASPPRACGSGSGTLSLLNGPGPVVRWESSTNLNTWVPISNTSTTLTYSGVTTTTHYRAVTNPGCTAYSTVASVIIDPVSVGGTVSPAGTVCTTGNVVSVTLSGHSPSIMRWEVNTGGGWAHVNTTANPLSYTLSAESTQIRAWVQSGSCPGVASTAVTFNRAPPMPTYTASTDPGPVTLTRGTPPANVVWYWQGSNPGGISTANSALTYEVNESDYYYLRARNSAGCWSSPYGQSVVVTAPPCQITGPRTGCATQTYHFSTDCNPTGSWSVNGGNVGSGPSLEYY